MGLLVHFNLVLASVCHAGLVATGCLSRELLRENARDEVVREARLILEAATAMRTCTVDPVRPHLAPLMTETFLPQTVPAFAATEAIKLRLSPSAGALAEQISQASQRAAFLKSARIGISAHQQRGTRPPPLLTHS